MPIPTFITTPGLSYLTGQSVPRTCKPCLTTSAPSVRRANITMQEKTKKKKKAKPVFALDMKGNFVWNLRSAASEDITAISALIPGLPRSIIQSIVNDSPCSVVCEASVKGTKEGEGYSGVVLGAALVDVSVVLKDDSVLKRADFITVVADPELPEVEDVQKKLVLGSLKKLKDEGVGEVTSDVVAEREDRIELLKNCLFNVSKKDGGIVRLTCPLAMQNPDPQKRWS